jgi:hypothetical protein
MVVIVAYLTGRRRMEIHDIDVMNLCVDCHAFASAFAAA